MSQYDAEGPPGSRYRTPRVPGSPRLVIALLFAALALSACTQGELSQQDLSLACEMHKCDCAPDNSVFKPGVGLLWNLDGSAYCPEDYHLRMLDLPPSQKMVT